MLDEIWQESSVAQAVREEGREEGRVEGRTEEARRIARLALSRRFGELGQDLLAALDQAQEATLEELVLESGLTLEQVRARLVKRAAD